MHGGIHENTFRIDVVAMAMVTCGMRATKRGGVFLRGV